MTALRAGEVEGLLRRGPDPRCSVFLVYGSDTGLVAERVRALIDGFVTDRDDPFALVRLDGDALASDPGRLADEAGTVGMFGGRRAIRIRVGGRNIAPSVQAVLDLALVETRIVLEGGDLAKSNPLRNLCETSAKALALPCYPDDARSLGELIERTLKARDLAIDRDAVALLAGSLGGDRLASLSEIEKLALYAAGRGRITSEDVEAVVSDVSGSALNVVVDAAFCGKADEVDRIWQRFRHEGLDAGVVLGAALRHAMALLASRLDHDGKTPAAMVAAWRGLHFSRRSSIETQLARWSPAALRRATALLQDAVLASRRHSSDLAAAQASDVLLRIAAEASRRAG